MMVALPVDVDDPLERVRLCHDNAVSAKESHQLSGPELISRWAAYFPPRAHGVTVSAAFQPRRPEQDAQPEHLERARARVNAAGSAARWSPRSIRWDR